MVQRGTAIAGCIFALLTLTPAAWCISRQADIDESAQSFSRVEDLGLPSATATTLSHAVETHDYLTAEKVLIPVIERDPHSTEAGRLLAFLGGIYFLNHDYLNAAVAWNKSQAIAPLPDRLSFSLAMTYIRMGHSSWARKLLQSLAAKDPKQPVYPYWLGRLDYDAQQYDQAILNFKRSIGLAPAMVRAYNNLGLCYYALNQNAQAIDNYKKAIDLDRSAAHPSAWPYLNLGIVLELMNRPEEAEVNLREAIRLEPQLAQAHFQLGNTLEHMGKQDAAVLEFREAARLDANYAEPHFALARLYRKLGRTSLAQQEVNDYLRIHHNQAMGGPSQDNIHP